MPSVHYMYAASTMITNMSDLMQFILGIVVYMVVTFGLLMLYLKEPKDEGQGLIVCIAWPIALPIVVIAMPIWLPVTLALYVSDKIKKRRQ